MYRLVRNEPYELIHLCFNVVASSLSTNSHMVNKGIVAINLVRFFENIGYRVKLDFFEAVRINDEYIYMVVNIKDENQELDVANCYFPMCNPAFLRRICFRVMECTPVKYKIWNPRCGKPLDEDETIRFIGVDDNTIIFSDPIDMGIFGTDIYEDAIAVFECIKLNRFLEKEQQIIFDRDSKKFVLKKKFYT